MIKLILTSIIFSFTLTSVASAHSSVSPSQTTMSKYETFTLSVPSEKEVPTVGIRLLIPDSLDRVTPFAKPGWTINTTKVGEKITQIEWTGSAIPAGQKDIFQFTVRTGTESTTLIWKAYQTYQGGEVVGWDQDPKASDGVNNPYSITEVKANELPSSAEVTPKDTKIDQFQFALTLGALAISILALWRANKNKPV